MTDQPGNSTENEQLPRWDSTGMEEFVPNLVPESIERGAFLPNEGEEIYNLLQLAEAQENYLSNDALLQEAQPITHLKTSPTNNIVSESHQRERETSQTGDSWAQGYDQATTGFRQAQASGSVEQLPSVSESNRSDPSNQHRDWTHAFAQQYNYPQSNIQQYGYPQSGAKSYDYLQQHLASTASLSALPRYNHGGLTSTWPNDPSHSHRAQEYWNHQNYSISNIVNPSTALKRQILPGQVAAEHNHDAYRSNRYLDPSAFGRTPLSSYNVAAPGIHASVLPTASQQYPQNPFATNTYSPSAHPQSYSNSNFLSVTAGADGTGWHTQYGHLPIPPGHFIPAVYPSPSIARAPIPAYNPAISLRASGRQQVAASTVQSTSYSNAQQVTDYRSPSDYLDPQDSVTTNAISDLANSQTNPPRQPLKVDDGTESNRKQGDSGQHEMRGEATGDEEEEKFNPSKTYGKLDPAPKSWGKPTEDGRPLYNYDEQGRLLGRLRDGAYSRDEIRKYLDEQKPAMWVQRAPSQGATRLDDEDKKCLWAGCPASTKRITSGWLRVAFDECPAAISNGTKDPFKFAGVMHLWCFEQCFDAMEFHRRWVAWEKVTGNRHKNEDDKTTKEKDKTVKEKEMEGKESPESAESSRMLQPESRQFSNEPKKKNPMALDLELDREIITETYNKWFEKRLAGDGGHFTMEMPRPHTDSLSYALILHHLRHETPARQRARTKRNETRPVEERNTIDEHVGDLGQYCKTLLVRAANKHKRAANKDKNTEAAQEADGQQTQEGGSSKAYNNLPSEASVEDDSDQLVEVNFSIFNAGFSFDSEQVLDSSQADEPENTQIPAKAQATYFDPLAERGGPTAPEMPSQQAQQQTQGHLSKKRGSDERPVLDEVRRPKKRRSQRHSQNTIAVDTISVHEDSDSEVSPMTIPTKKGRCALAGDNGQGASKPRQQSRRGLREIADAELNRR